MNTEKQFLSFAEFSGGTWEISDEQRKKITLGPVEVLPTFESFCN